MATEKNITLQELIESINYRLNHIEDITADNRKIMVKLVKQGNQIVEFLKQIDIEDVDPYYEESNLEVPSLPSQEADRTNRLQSIKELIDDYMDRHEELKELEDELQKHKDKINPGQIGES
tara:strand:- start:52 stop:414 length:363 start_codon:yes stop_codon:yes gene_type:complete